MMQSSNVLSLLQRNTIYKNISLEPKKNLLLKGLNSSSFAAAVAISQQTKPSINIVVSSSKDDAAYFDNDITDLIGAQSVGFFPSSFKKSIIYGGDSPSGQVQRISLLNRIKQLDSKSSFIISTYPEALSEKVVSSKRFERDMLVLSVEDHISISEIADKLFQFEFRKVDFVYEPGQFSIRGGIIDIFPYSDSTPYRIDTFGDSIDSIRGFDVGTQRSIDKRQSVTVIPNLSSNVVQDKLISLIEFIQQVSKLEVNVWFSNVEAVVNCLDDLRSKLTRRAVEGVASVESIFSQVLSSNELIGQIEPLAVAYCDKVLADIEPNETLSFNLTLQPSFSKNFELLADNLLQLSEDGYKTVILTHNSAQAERIESIIQSLKGKENKLFEHITQSLHQGFVDHDAKVAIYTDHNIFERHHRYKITNEIAKPESITIAELNALEMGDFVVHQDHGVGKYGGVVKSVEAGKTKESIRLIYKDNDTLFVDIHSIHKISKYKDKESVGVAVHKLGSGVWQRLKQKTKAKVKDIAKDLIALYAKRRSVKGFSFSADTYLQAELEASFIYEDTPDQHKATEAVKREMERDAPMDMLICGDVGFGKTEVAMRAAFKAVTDNKQVALLVPTTVLAMQHQRTFLKRLKEFPVTIEMVSRTKTAKQISEIAKRLEQGKIDILIGTHKLLSKQFTFKDLGLLIVDEEQKFGVTTKEKLRTMKQNVDTLTLTATPIPRTLQFSLMGARDMVVINTPPPNRQPVTTQVHTFDTELLKEAIDYEMSRNGQVFIIHNRVDSLYHIKEIVTSLSPEARVGIGHGQMKPAELEQVMMDFIYGDLDIFISTTIVESGIDIPNANTMIINDAQNFGLSELHQLRGRVGRTNRKAFCYLFTPPSGRITTAGDRRLKAIEEYSDLGSGLNIAMQDLDIRGAGNILGMEQSGFVTDMGYETFQKILSEAMSELKDEIGANEAYSNMDAMPQSVNYVSDCRIDTTLEAIIPDSYVSNTNEKMRLYRMIDLADNQATLETIKESMRDRFGQLPQAAENLIGLVQLRRMVKELGIEKIILKNGRFILHFVYNHQSSYYSSELFGNILKYLSQCDSRYKFKLVNDVNLLTISDIFTVNDAVITVQQIRKSVGLAE